MASLGLMSYHKLSKYRFLFYLLLKLRVIYHKFFFLLLIKKASIEAFLGSFFETHLQKVLFYLKH